MGWLVIEDLKKAGLATILALSLAALIAIAIPGARADQDSRDQSSEQTSRP
ncbi:MAG: hypothetical protein AB7G62_07785 [Magnetospirillum sp.]